MSGLAGDWPGRVWLFTAGKGEEILRQAMRAYREVLRDPEFGDLLTGVHEPGRWDHLFATIDSVTSRDLVAAVGADHWHTVVIDQPQVGATASLCTPQTRANAGDWGS